MNQWTKAKVTFPLEILHEMLKGRKSALMMNTTARGNHGESLIDAIPAWDGVNVAFFIGMEHGVRGNLFAADPNLQPVDEKTGIPIVNLYDYPDWKPPVEELKKVDVVVFSAQDTGVRHWTYTPWMLTLVEAAAKAGCEVIILDRPNPMGGKVVEGGFTEPQYRFTELINGFGYPLRHGMTIGELAKMYNETEHIGCKLTVLPMAGYNRSMFYEETGLPWLPGSPNMPTVDTCFYFASTGLFQGTNLCYGIGSTTPFQYIGATWMDGAAVEKELNSRCLPGAFCVQKYYSISRHGEPAQLYDGVLLLCQNREQFRPVTLQLNMMDVLTQMYPGKVEFDRHYLTVVRMGTEDIIKAAKSGAPILPVLEKWQAQSEEFMEARKPYLIYPEN